MHKLSPTELKCPPGWGASSLPHEAVRRRFKMIEIVVPAMVMGVLLFLNAKVMAVIVGCLAGALLLLGLLAAPIRQRVDRGLAIFAEWLGRIVAYLLLALPFFVVMPAVRLGQRLTGNDPLHLRSGGNLSYWLPADHEPRRKRHIRNMFCSEFLGSGKRLGILPLFITGIVLLGATEVCLRLTGFGSPILFVQDSEIGYYPKPRQIAKYPGRTVEINNFGMRAPDIGEKKPPGMIRILMIGDSTLAGTKVSNSELYSTLLENQLNQTTGQPIFQVLNMGVNAWGPLHERAFIRKFGTFDADIAIICGPVANCFRPKYGLERLPFSPAERPPRTALGHVAYELMWRVREHTLGAPPWALPGPIQDAQAGIGTEAYADMASFFQENGAEVFMEMLPARQFTLGMGNDPDGARLFARIQSRMKEIGVAANCAGPIFKDAKDRESIYHDGVHFDVYGHQLYAAYLAERLRKNSKTVQGVIIR